MPVPWFDVDSAFAEMDAFRRQVDALLGARGLDGRHGLHPLRSEVRVATGFVDEGEAWSFRADLPGLKADELKLTLHDGVLKLEAERDPAAPEGFTHRHRERRAFALSRSWRLPENADGDGVDATLESGVLTVRVPKRPESQPRRIDVVGA